MASKIKVVHAHQMVANTAMELANVLYDEMMEDNLIYKSWKSQHANMGPKALRNAFVKKYWASCIPAARATLAGMLNGSYDDDWKAKVHEGLVLDSTLKLGRNGSPQFITKPN